jgi:hypothetical protein
MSLTCDRSVIFSVFSSFHHQKTDRHDIAEILLKLPLNNITITLKCFKLDQIKQLLFSNNVVNADVIIIR